MDRPTPDYAEKKFENGGFDLKTHEMSFVHNTPEEFFKGNNHPVILDLFEETTVTEII